MTHSIAFAALVALLATITPVVSAETLRYVPKKSELKYVFATADPVLRVRPGDIVETEAADQFENVKDPKSGWEPLRPNPQTGPFYVEGAEPGDALAVTILDLEVSSDVGVGGIFPGFGILTSSKYTPMLGPSAPARYWLYPIDKEKGVAEFRAKDSDFTVKIPLAPFLGCLGVAPADGEARSTITPGEWGGNMDAPPVRKGTTVYLPVNVKGALLYLGDGHAAQGEGEIAGTAIEVGMKVKIQVDVIKGQKLAWPRMEDADYLMAVGSYRPLEDALRIAYTELIAWLHREYGLSELDAYELLSKVSVTDVAEVVDPNYTVIAKIPKKFLPPKTKGPR
ncbi:MAG TPA: acetamidase/formamidase family protein [Candidatus Acidoferrales bacterium]